MSQPQLNTWEQVYKGGERRARQVAKEYRMRGYFVRMKSHTTHWTVEISEAKLYERFPRNERS